MSRAANRRHNPRRDDNEPEIVEALKWQGALVERINGQGVPDLLCGYNGRLILVEVKNPDTYWRLTDNEAAWHEAWAGFPVFVVTTPQEAVDALACAAASAFTKSKYEFVPIAPDWVGV